MDNDRTKQRKVMSFYNKLRSISSARVLLCLWHFLTQTFNFGAVVALNQKLPMALNAESSDCQPGVCASDVPKESFRCVESECSVWGQTFGIKKKKKKQASEPFTSLYWEYSIVVRSPEPIATLMRSKNWLCHLLARRFGASLLTSLCPVPSSIKWGKNILTSWGNWDKAFRVYDVSTITC